MNSRYVYRGFKSGRVIDHITQDSDRMALSTQLSMIRIKAVHTWVYDMKMVKLTYGYDYNGDEL